MAAMARPERWMYHTVPDEAIEVEIGQIPGIPHTWDELSECLKEGEEEYERGEGILWEDAVQQIKSHLRIYGS